MKTLMHEFLSDSAMAHLCGCLEHLWMIKRITHDMPRSFLSERFGHDEKWLERLERITNDLWDINDELTLLLDVKPGIFFHKDEKEDANDDVQT